MTQDGPRIITSPMSLREVSRLDVLVTHVDHATALATGLHVGIPIVKIMLGEKMVSYLAGAALVALFKALETEFGKEIGT